MTWRFWRNLMLPDQDDDEDDAALTASKQQLDQAMAVQLGQIHESEDARYRARGVIEALRQAREHAGQPLPPRRANQ